MNWLNSPALPGLLRVLSVLATGLVLWPSFPAGAADDEIEKPNVIVFLADDMGIGDTSAYQDFTGNADDAQVATPNLERLARMGVRFTDAHTPASRCTPTRYGLLTGRHPWRGRLKYWVLFGAQGDPLIEPDRPTLATLFRGEGYGTAMVGKWHVGLRYRRSDGGPAAGWEDADLTQPLFDTPLDHGFDMAKYTSRSHGTSGLDASRPAGKKKKKGKEQNSGPGHLDGRDAVGATGNGKELVTEGPNAYVLTQLGGRHSDHAVEYLGTHLREGENAEKPFFLYYAANSNHSPYTPDDEIGGVSVKGAARTKSGQPMDARHDFIYENDVALGRLLDWLEANEDPRHPGRKMIETTVVIFSSDNGAEIESKVATGPFRSHKGSCFEGGHRVPFIVAWGAGGIGDGVADTPGQTSREPIGLTDLYATFSELLAVPLPDLAKGEKGAEDSFSVLSAWRGGALGDRPPLFFNDHSESSEDPAVLAMRVDSPVVSGTGRTEGQWKIFFDASLAREGRANPFVLYELGSDQREETNRISEPELEPLVEYLKALALDHRNSGGHRVAELVGAEERDRVVFDWRSERGNGVALADQPVAGIELTQQGVTMTVSAVAGGAVQEDRVFRLNGRGLGVSGGKADQVDGGEALRISFDRDVIVESAAIVAGEGVCGGFYRVGDDDPLPIYCVDADNDDKEHQGILSDLGVLKAGEILQLDSGAYLGTEGEGAWRLGALTVRRVR